MTQQMQIKQSSYVLNKKELLPLKVASLKKVVDQFTYLGRNISSTESDVNIRLTKAWNAIECYRSKMDVWSIC